MQRFVAAVAAAWRTPAVIESGLSPLLLSGGSHRARTTNTKGAAHAMRLTQRALNALARIPGSRWRTTCLYRSVAECLVLRHLGLPARVVLGVQRDGDVRAHAWVECAGVACTCTRGAAEYTTLARAAND